MGGMETHGHNSSVERGFYKHGSLLRIRPAFPGSPHLSKHYSSRFNGFSSKTRLWECVPGHCNDLGIWRNVCLTSGTQKWVLKSTSKEINVECTECDEKREEEVINYTWTRGTCAGKEVATFVLVLKDEQKFSRQIQTQKMFEANGQHVLCMARLC